MSSRKKGLTARRHNQDAHSGVGGMQTVDLSDKPGGRVSSFTRTYQSQTQTSFRWRDVVCGVFFVAFLQFAAVFGQLYLDQNNQRAATDVRDFAEICTHPSRNPKYLQLCEEELKWRNSSYISVIFNLSVVKWVSLVSWLSYLPVEWFAKCGELISNQCGSLCSLKLMGIEDSAGDIVILVLQIISVILIGSTAVVLIFALRWVWYGFQGNPFALHPQHKIYNSNVTQHFLPRRVHEPLDHTTSDS